MTYIIEYANILRDQKLTKASLLIDNGSILSIKQDFKRYKYTKMNAEPFIMTPTSILYKKDFPFDKPFLEMKKYYIEEFILKGCTAFLTMATIKYEYELSNAINRLKVQLLNSPIDYIIGVRVPIRLLTQSFLRKCKQEKVPAIFVDIYQMDELYDLPWGWLREAMFPYNSPLIPIFMNANKQDANEWNRLMNEEKIPFVEDELTEDQPIPKAILSKIGIYPFKGGIYQGCELSYNFYLKSREIRKIEESQLFHYHREKLVITVQNGDVVRSGSNVVFRPGYGKHVKIKTPSFFRIDV
ncbi:hypothetical protein RRV45_13980 [Bacillus sp. DTU_2020_1000418_1_SI_GHA_SEK_038]|uniref:hypothetical protein n=1 Tax=Bacillus sp. DTU_2020_1000418_1_SI_GHA_SEK_038 TaxID=3077585 RepID=UPI0028E834CB|nr:hypothetical protein [Bacillus sp. DTU_2020_1000418_1_SI_GHA_SEK_038]WNS74024.1 hypothetical protein RRV45_13980 [Bacillus sp. DTU_2020_1000418_1_SI_GHA_SEK_038]